VTPLTGTLIANAVSPNVQTGLTAATTYFYVVTAANTAGASPPSAQVSATTLPATPALDGAALYATNCARCHNPLATSAKRLRTALQIQTAINTNRGGMGIAALIALTPAEIQAIATALNF
jgi:mono/diheme cytochrome c family protein